LRALRVGEIQPICLKTIADIKGLENRQFVIDRAPGFAATRIAGKIGYHRPEIEQRTGEKSMLIATTENVAGHRVVRTYGEVFGVVVRSRGLGGNIMAGLRSLAGGEIHEYTHLLEETRTQAIERMVANAQKLGANAIVMMRFDSSSISNSMSEIVAYGTAVYVEPAT
jgi:uncharacterized protein YbjQ (UPF0145 family)